MQMIDHLPDAINRTELADALSAIRPRLRGHAGDMELTGTGDGTVEVHFSGACESCPAMAVTFAGLVRTQLLKVHGISRVEAPQVHASPRTLNRIALTLGGTVVRDGDNVPSTPWVRR